MPLVTLFLLSGALHFYIGARLVPELPGATAPSLGLLLAASAVLVPLGLFARRTTRGGSADRVACSAYSRWGCSRRCWC